MAIGTKNDYLFLRRNNKQLYDAIFGFAIGDALGVLTNFRNEEASFARTSQAMAVIISRQAPGRMILP